jgi:hypothetical protein
VCTEGAKTEVDMSVFDVLNVLHRRLLITREELVKQVWMASKDAEGLVDWAVLHPEFHSTLAKCALVPSSWPLMADPVSLDTQHSMFVLLLEVLNGHGADSFWALLDGGAKDNRAMRERRRLSVKQHRAAKRESARMDLLDRPKAVAVKDVPPAGPKQQRKTCSVCDKTYGSRRQRRRHACLRLSSPSSIDETDNRCVRAEEEALEALALDKAGSTNSSTPPAIMDPFAGSNVKSPAKPG